MEREEIRELVKKQFNGLAAAEVETPAARGFGGEAPAYEPEAIRGVPDVAIRLSSGVGDTVAAAAISPGDSVLDFGCGAGLDLILAAREVGAQGRVIGIDIAEGMIARAKEGVAAAGLQDQQIFLRATAAEDAPIPCNFANVVMANGLLRFCPDKEKVYRNCFRILKPGGFLVIADYVLAKGAQDGAGGVGGCSGGVEYIVPAEVHAGILRQMSFCYVHTSEEVLSVDDLARAVRLDPMLASYLPSPHGNRLARATITGVRPHLGC